MLGGTKNSEIHQAIIDSIQCPFSFNDLHTLISNLKNIAILRDKVSEGDYQGVSTLWLLACLAIRSWGYDSIFSEILNKYKDELTLDDFRIAAHSGPDKGKTILWLTGSMASRGQYERFEFLWKKFGKEIIHSDLQTTAQAGEFAGQSLLGLLMKAKFLNCPGLIEKIPTKLPTLNEKTVFIALDLDHTHFLSHRKEDVYWIGNKERWLKLYSKATEIAAEKNVSLVFTIITSKDALDDLAHEAIDAFWPLLAKHNPIMTLDHAPHHWLLVNIDGKLCYLSMSNKMIESLIVPANAISHVMLVPWKEGYEDHSRKTTAIKQYCTTMGIPLKQSLLLDDDPDILAHANKNGISTVSCECFHVEPGWSPPDQLNDENYIRENLDKIEAEFIKKCKVLIEQASALSVEKLSEKLGKLNILAPNEQDLIDESAVTPLRFTTTPDHSLPDENSCKSALLYRKAQ